MLSVAELVRRWVITITLVMYNILRYFYILQCHQAMGSLKSQRDGYSSDLIQLCISYQHTTRYLKDNPDMQLATTRNSPKYIPK
jgi:hypothetical protein